MTGLTSLHFALLALTLNTAPLAKPPHTNTLLHPTLSVPVSLCQGYEDWLRHKADNSINQCPVHVVQHGKVVRKQSRKLRVCVCVCVVCVTR